MYDVQIDFDEFYREFGIKITNPIHHNNRLSVRYKIMICLREWYLRHRNMFKKIFREKSTEEFMLDSRNDFDSESYKINCAAESQLDCKTGKMVQPYFELETIEIVDILPKEFIPEFQKKIQKMVQGSQVNGLNNIEEAYIDEYKKVQDSCFCFNVAVLSFKQGSKFAQYASTLNIEMLSLSSSFVGLVFRFWINDEWKEKINNLCVTGRDKHEFYSGMDKLKLYQFRRIGKGSNPGNIYKEKVLSVLLEELKYRLAKELYKEFRTVIFSMNEKPIAFNVFRTNIDGNSSEAFWRSIGIEARFCDYLKNQDACINSLHRDSFDLDYIYKKNKSDQYDSQCFAYDIVYSFTEYLSVVGLRNAIEDKITQISVWIQRGKKADFDTWLQIKACCDNDLMYAKRFVNEFKIMDYLDLESFERKNGTSIAKDVNENLDKTVDHCKKLIEDILSVVNANVDAKSSTASYRIQRTTFYTNLCSAILALVAIFISFIPEDVKSIVISYMGENIIIKCMLFLAVLSCIVYLLKGMINGLIKRCRRFYIFR